MTIERDEQFQIRESANIPKGEIRQETGYQVSDYHIGPGHCLRKKGQLYHSVINAHIILL